MPVDIVVDRPEKDGLALSSEAIDRFKSELFHSALTQALMQAINKGVMPRRIRLVGKIEID